MQLQILLNSSLIFSISHIEVLDSAEHSLVDFYGIIFSDMEAAMNRMLSCKLKKHRSCDLQTHLAIEAKVS